MTSDVKYFMLSLKKSSRALAFCIHIHVHTIPHALPKKEYISGH